MKHKVGDIVSVRVKISSITEDESNKFTYKIKCLQDAYDSMTVKLEDIVGTSLQVPTDIVEE